jgi:hypothetical protein
VVGKTSLVQLSSLMLELRFCSLSGGFLLGHTSSALSEFSLLSLLGRGLTMLTRDILTPLPQLPFAGGYPRAFPRPRQKQSESDQYQYNDNYDDDQCCRHHYLRSVVGSEVRPHPPAPLLAAGELQLLVARLRRARVAPFTAACLPSRVRSSGAGRRPPARPIEPSKRSTAPTTSRTMPMVHRIAIFAVKPTITNTMPKTIISSPPRRKSY